MPFARRVAALGLRNGLVQTALKLTVPGVPDVYRGAELLDLSMVDPDNRRPVDFAQRAELLSEVEDVPVEALAGRTDGAQKLALTARLLRLRRRLPGLFSEGGYEPMPFDDARLLGFVRRHADLALAVAVLRSPEGADDTAEVRLPDAPSEWTDVLGEGTGEGRGTLGASLPVMVRLAGGSAGDAG